MRILSARKIHNDQGVVFVTVLMIIIVMMLLTVTVISLNVSQVMTTEGEVQRLKAQELARGMIFYTAGAVHITNPAAGSGMTITPGAENLDGLTFTPRSTVGIAGSGIDNTRTVTINVAY